MQSYDLEPNFIGLVDTDVQTFMTHGKNAIELSENTTSERQKCELII